jgi:hypothetical protein
MRPFCLVLAINIAFVGQGCGRESAEDDASKPIVMPTQPIEITAWRDFKMSATPVLFRVPVSTRIIHDNHEMLYASYYDGGCILTWTGVRVGRGNDPVKAQESVARRVAEETTGKAVVAPPRDFPLKSGSGSYWADITGNTKRKHRLLFAYDGWSYEVSAECEGDKVPEILKPVFDSITMSAAAADSPLKNL